MIGAMRHGAALQKSRFPERQYATFEEIPPVLVSALLYVENRDLLAPGTVQDFWINFPDPWPKKRHHKRRLIAQPFVGLLASRIAPGGYLHCATDWENYAEQMLEVLSAEPSLQNTADGYAPRPDYRPLTKFEQRGLRLGHGVWDLKFQRIA